MNNNFDGRNFREKAPGFVAPTQLPAGESEARDWQESNRMWWERSAMRYDWRVPIKEEPGSAAYFAEIDRRFLASARAYLPWKGKPFESLIPYADLQDKDVLEIGVGHGTHAQLIAPHCRRFTGIDLTEAACVSTRTRLGLAGIQAQILQMDAEAMEFGPASFDFIWSWGVIHHSANISRIVGEMHRVLRPDGRATVMVYYRSPVWYYLIHGIVRGLLRGEFWSTGNIHRINQAATDGALARFFSIAEFKELVRDRFVVERATVSGQKTDAIPLPHGRFKTLLLGFIPDWLTRLMTRYLRFGTFLIVEMRRV